MSKRAERATLLVRLAVSTSGNEAHVAALKACQLIANAGLVIVEAPKERPSSKAAPSDLEKRIKKVIMDTAKDTAAKVTIKDIMDLFSEGK